MSQFISNVVTDQNSKSGPSPERLAALRALPSPGGRGQSLKSARASAKIRATSGESMKKFTCVILGIALLAVPALAHHSAAAYDTQKEIKVTGTVTEYRFKNPHVYMTVQVKNADGSAVPMDVEAGAASVLSPLGFNRDSVTVGDVVTIVGNPSRSNAERSMLGKD